ncbi:MAG: hypothetical protein JST63_20045 [Bacteroidetes bacterium]|nr:hypothetical protein [Bacteroidota bacterium]
MAKKFLWRSLFFTLPFVIFFIIIAFLDPFNYLGKNGIINDNIKQLYSGKINYALWELNAYKKHPTENILLGDSRIMLVDTGVVNKIKHKKFVNLGYGGGSLKEAIETFWYASSVCRLHEVYLGINLELYNQNNIGNRVKGVEIMLKNPLLYFTNSDVIEAAYYCFMNRNKHSENSIEIPPMTRDEFWKFQLSETAERYYSTYGYPSEYNTELSKMARYCQEKKILLHFIVLPTHTDLQNKISAFHLQDANDRFIHDLKELGDVYNLNLNNKYTRVNENFNDPFHFKRELFNEIYSPIIFGNKTTDDSTADIHLYVH